MKKIAIKTSRFSLVVAIVLVITMFACNDENGVGLEVDTDSDTISDDVELETSYEEVDDLALAGASYDFSTGGRYESDERFECATLTKEETDTGIIITIDFGEGCEGPYGRVRAGIIRITKSGDHWESGSVISTEMIGFSIDDLALEGVRTVTNISESIGLNPVFKVILIGGKATWPDGTSATREVDRIRTLVVIGDVLGDEIQVKGTSSGINREGESVEVLIQEPLIFLRSCRGGRKFVPVAGIKQITKGGEVAIIDFGEDVCDNIAMKTVNGVTTEITISPRRFRGN